MRLPCPLSDEIATVLAGARGRPLIVFDGDCVLCSGSAQFVMRRDPERVFALTTAQDGAGQAFYRALGLSTRDFETMLLVADGQVLTESDAALAIASRLGWPWRLAVAARAVPAVLRDAVYRLVARRRYRWFGRRSECWRPSPGDRDRIL